VCGWRGSERKKRVVKTSLPEVTAYLKVVDRVHKSCYNGRGLS
jgi:hypothetical protein